MNEHNFGVRYLIKPNSTRRRTNLGSYTFYTHTNEFVMDLICYNQIYFPTLNMRVAPLIGRRIVKINSVWRVKYKV